MIICGYAGIGKSYLAEHLPNVMDLESTPFEKDWERYAKCAIHYSRQGRLVLVSCHKELREILNKELRFDERITIVPNVNDKEWYKEKYTQRGNTQTFIDMQMNNWEKWLDEGKNRFIGEHWEVLEPHENLYDWLKRFSKKEPYHFCTYDNCPVYPNCIDMDDRCINPLKKYIK